MDSRSSGFIVTTKPDAFAPDATCDSCGGRGTVARVQRTDGVDARLYRYCRQCWPERRAEQIRQQVNEGARYATLQRDPHLTWESLTALVAALERVLPTESAYDPWTAPPWRGHLKSMAKYLEVVSRNLSGPMPQSIRSFIQRTGRAI